MAMERRDKEREMVAVLLNVLCPEPLKPQDLTVGFSLVLQTIKVHTACWPHICDAIRPQVKMG